MMEYLINTEENGNALLEYLRSATAFPLKDVIIESYKVQHNTVQPPDPDSQELWKLKEQILICERELLRVLRAYALRLGRPVRRDGGESDGIRRKLTEEEAHADHAAIRAIGS